MAIKKSQRSAPEPDLSIVYTAAYRREKCTHTARLTTNVPFPIDIPLVDPATR